MGVTISLGGILRISLMLICSLLLIVPHESHSENRSDADLKGITTQIKELISEGVSLTTVSQVHNQIAVEGEAQGKQHVMDFLKAIKDKRFGYTYTQQLSPQQSDKFAFHFVIAINLEKAESFTQKSTLSDGANAAPDKNNTTSINVKDSSAQHKRAALVNATNTTSVYPRYEPEPYIFKPDVVKKYKHNLWHYDFLIDVFHEIGCTGHLIYAEEGKFSEEELEWLRMLLAYRFNGTRINHTIFEEISDSRVSDSQVEYFLALPEFSNWIGPDLIKQVQNLKQKRAALIEVSNTYKWNQDDIFSTPVFLDYSKSADKLLATLINKFSIIYEDDSDDCD